jgi:hypothetical protein
MPGDHGEKSNEAARPQAGSGLFSRTVKKAGKRMGNGRKKVERNLRRE